MTLLTLLLLCSVAVFSSIETVAIQFRLKQWPRFYTPLNDKIYLASSYNQWRPNDKLFEFNSVSKTLVIDFQNVTNIEFKITRGSWSMAETWADGTARANRKLSLSSTAQIIDLIVEQWSDMSGRTPTATNQVYILDSNFSMSPHLLRTRRIWLYLPRSYFIDTNRYYPVIYAHDAQNLFDSSTSFSGEWGIDETLDNLSKDLIVVGIDNGGADRLNELTPYANPQYGGGQANYYLDFIVEKLRPYINANYRTKTDRENTGIIGSSLGGLCSFHAAIRHGNIFGQIGVFSPSFWFTDDIYNSAEKSTFPNAPRIYFLGGSLEGSNMVGNIQRMTEILKRVNSKYLNSNQLQIRFASDGQHQEWFWKREFPNAIQWLFR